MPVIVLLRHGVSSANTTGILAGRTPGVSLTEDGVGGLEATLRMLPRTAFALLRRSSLLRCEQTAQIAADLLDVGESTVDDDFVELDYGDWTGRSLEDLSSTPEWATVSERASRMRFPAGEAIAEAAARATRGIDRLLTDLRAIEHVAPEDKPDEKPTPAWGLVVSHADIIKAIIASALRMPLDDFQRLAVAPGSFTVIDYSGAYPVMTAMSVTAGGLAQAGVPGGGGLRAKD